jgi:biotin carboxyl carrier protein
MPDTMTSETAFAVPERTTMTERLVVAPSSGRFRALPSDEFYAEGEWVEPGAMLGEIYAHGNSVVVQSSHRGWVMGMLVLENQPVKKGEALFWMRGC